MSTSLAPLPHNVKAEDPHFEVSGLGTFYVQPQSESRLVVRTASMLVAQVIYGFAGTAQQHNDGRWYLVKEMIQAPKLAPKAMADVIDKITTHLRSFMDSHPEIMGVLAVRSWEQTVRDSDRVIYNTEYQRVEAQRRLEQHMRDTQRAEERLMEAQATLNDALKSPPKGANLSKIHDVQSRYLQSLIAQQATENTDHTHTAIEGA